MAVEAEKVEVKSVKTGKQPLSLIQRKYEVAGQFPATSLMYIGLSPALPQGEGDLGIPLMGFSIHWQ